MQKQTRKGFPSGFSGVLTCFLLAAFVLALFGCGNDPAAKTEEDNAAERRIKDVQLRSVGTLIPKGTIPYVGVLTAFRKVNVSSEIGGVIEKLLFEKGDMVEEGKLLAEVGSSSAGLQVRETEAAVAVVRSRLKTMEKGSRPQEIQIAEANVEEAEAALFEAEKMFGRVKQLHGIKAISGSEYDATERQVATAKARMESAKQRLTLALQGPRIEDIKTARANLRQAEAGLALQKDLFRKSMIHAPCRGIIAFRNVEKGEIVRAGTPITRIIDLQQIKINVSLGEKDIHVLREKERFDFTVDAIPGEKFSCTLLFLSPTADPVTRSFPTEFAVYDPDPRMADGMTVRLELPTVAHGRKIKIPSAWLAEEDGKTGIFLVDDGKAIFREVTLGAYYDNRIEILSGLKEDEQIIINPSGLTSGDSVNP